MGFNISCNLSFRQVGLTSGFISTLKSILARLWKLGINEKPTKLDLRRCQDSKLKQMLTLVILKSRNQPPFNFLPIRLLDPHCCFKFIYLMANRADPDQLASSEANWSGSGLFAKAGYIQVQKDKSKGEQIHFQGKKLCQWFLPPFWKGV